ncbi:MAG: hypothetical protein Q4G67_06220 [Actinomycetia bacterium]|nr:hypothetical protein [Actinomycetes bacterium]
MLRRVIRFAPLIAAGWRMFQNYRRRNTAGQASQARQPRQGRPGQRHRDQGRAEEQHPGQDYGQGFDGR